MLTLYYIVHSSALWLYIKLAC